MLDWGDACVSHPFFTLSVSLEGVLQWGLYDVEDAVDVAPFRDELPRALRRGVPRRRPGRRRSSRPCASGWVCRAVNGHLLTGADHTMTRLTMFLDGTT